MHTTSCLSELTIILRLRFKVSRFILKYSILTFMVRNQVQNAIFLAYILTKTRKGNPFSVQDHFGLLLYIYKKLYFYEAVTIFMLLQTRCECCNIIYNVAKQ